MSVAKPKVSFEFFPTRTPEGRAKQILTRQELKQFQPEFFSCTSGAGGSTRDGTLQTVRDILAEQTPIAPHLPCIGMLEQEVIDLLEQYKNMGVNRIVALRGDIPSGTGFGMEGLRYASDLVSLIKSHYGNHFHIDVAAYPECHPQSPNSLDNLRHFAQKVQAGADSAITQYFFNTDAYFQFCDDAQKFGIDIPIVPGIIPVDSFTKLSRFSEMCGAEIPRWLRLKLYSFADDADSIRAFALDVVTEMCERLLQGGAPGLHFYTLNRADLAGEICKRIMGRDEDAVSVTS